MDMNYNRHYIRLDGNLIVKAFSDAFEQPEEGDICVNENGGRHFNLDLYREDGLPRYKYDYENELILETTNEDLVKQLETLVLKEELQELEKRLSDTDWIIIRQMSTNDLDRKINDLEFDQFVLTRDQQRNRIDEIRSILNNI
jgi:enolase